MREFKPDKILQWESINNPGVPFWLTNEQLIPGVHYPEEKNSWTKIWYFTFNSTWNITISWMWFKPKLVQFFYTDQISWYGQGAMTADYQFAFDVVESKSSSQSDCIYIRNAWWSVIWRAEKVSLNDWGFTINVTFAPWTTVRVNYIAQ